MADLFVVKTAATPNVASVLVAGSIAANSITVAFDDASNQADLMALLEAAKLDILNYFADRSS